jgi:hypothetical protein
MNYWVKRNTGAKGPFSETAIEGFIESGRLPESVLVSESPEGPWEAFPIIAEDVDAIRRNELVLKQKQQTAKAKRQLARRERGREPEEERFIIPYSQSYSQYYTSAVCLVCLLIVVALILSMRLPGDGFSSKPEAGFTVPSIGKQIVTFDEYQRIQNGMSYRQVVNIIGADGEEMSRNNIDGVPGVIESIDTVMYQWVNSNGSNMNAMFQNDKLNQKAQFGLK